MTLVVDGKNITNCTQPIRSGIRLLVAVAPCVLLLSACAAKSLNPPTPKAQTTPTYEQLVARYNRNVEPILRLSSLAVVEMTWREDGRRRFEQGDGQLAVVVPDRMSLKVGKAGIDFLRAGCNETRYWMFDLGGDEKVMHVGLHAKVAESVEAAFGLPVRPRDLIRLLGVIRIHPVVNGPSPRVEQFKGNYLIEPPGCHCRMLLDAKTARPVRIDLLDARGFSRVTARHKRFAHVKTEGVSPGRWSFVPTLITIDDARKRAQIKLSLSGVIGDADAIDSRWFDPAFLAEALQPDVVSDIDARHKLTSQVPAP